MNNDGNSSTLAQAIYLADLDGDGFMDVVLAVNVGSQLGQIWILKNLGNGFFRTIGRKTIGTNIWDIAVVKLNNDGYLDFVMATQIGVVIGYGDSHLFPTSFEQRDQNILELSLIAGDFNGDGKTDFAVMTYSNPQIRVFLNSPLGIPENPISYQTGFGAASLNCADINGDGQLDLLTVGDTGNFRIFYGSRTGTFDSSELKQNDLPISGVAFADFDLNGKLDMGVSLYEQLSSTSPKAGVFLNAPNPARYYTDFDGDNKSDFTVYRPSTGIWWTLKSRDYSFQAVKFGLATDKVVTGNYDGDNRADIAVYRDGIWYILRSSDNSFRFQNWGLGEDIPVPGDYENDGVMKPAVFRPSTGYWYLKKDNGFDAIKWGLSTDRPVPADFDGDGKTDVAVYRPSEGVWYIRSSLTGELIVRQFGLADDKPVPADFDGDGIADIAVFRPSDSYWYILQSSTATVRYVKFGLRDDVPVPNDFDGDGKSDIAVYRPSEGVWYFLRSSDSSFNAIRWGTGEDIPIRSF